MKRKNILITGGTGLLGHALIKINKNFDIRSVYIGDYDIKNQKNAEYIKADVRDKNFDKKVLKKFKPDFIIHTAGIANVDYCEQNPKEAEDSNLNGTKNMISICNKYNAHLIYISTNAVYDGENPPYTEKSVLNPINVYGKVKAGCENIVSSSGIKNTIVRPILMYGWNNPNERSNPVTWIIEQLEQGNKINMVNDVYENPLFADSAAEAIWVIVNKEISGVFNLAGKDVINRYESANQVAEVFKLNKDLINPVTSNYFETLAPRPIKTFFKTNKMEKILGIEPLKFMEGLKRMKAQDK